MARVCIKWGRVPILETEKLRQRQLESGLEPGFETRLSAQRSALPTHQAGSGLNLVPPSSRRESHACCVLGSMLGIQAGGRQCLALRVLTVSGQPRKPAAAVLSQRL